MPPATPIPARSASANEDALCLDAALGLYAVADGMGGHRAGEVASHLALEALVDQVIASRQPGFAWPYGRDAARDDAANELAHAVRAANARVVEAGERDPELSGMGTTLTALASAPATSPSPASATAAAIWSATGPCSC